MRIATTIVALIQIIAFSAPRLLKDFDLPVLSFTPDKLPALLDFVESTSSWGEQGRDLGRKTFEQTLGQPGLDLLSHCFLLEEGGRVQGYCLVHHEPPISRMVLEPNVATQFEGTSAEQELFLRALRKAEEHGPGVVHVCVQIPSPLASFLAEQGFESVRSYDDMVWDQKSLPSAEIPDGFSVRSFQPGDAALLTEVQNSAFASSWGFCPNTVEQIEYRSSMVNMSHQGICFLMDGEKTAGYCWTCLVPVNDSIRGMIGMIGVVPDYRGRGISSSILVAGMEALRYQNVADIGLQVDSSNTPGVRLYTSIGFQKVGTLNWLERLST